MVDLSVTEKQLISKALQLARKSFKDIDSGHLEFINDIEEDLTKENILLSRTQIDVVVYYLDTLLMEIQYDNAAVLQLQHKLNSFSDLP